MFRFTRTFVATALTLTGPLAMAADDATGPYNRFYAGLSYASGVNDLLDKIEANNPGVEAQKIWPVGLILGGYRSFGNSIAVGGTLGPVVIGTGDYSFSIVPLCVDVRYTFARSGSTGYYGRLGVEKAFVGGDLLDSSSAGAVMALGVEFAAPMRTGWGIELAARSTEVTVSANGNFREQAAKPYKASLAVFFMW